MHMGFALVTESFCGTNQGGVIEKKQNLCYALLNGRLWSANPTVWKRIPCGLYFHESKVFIVSANRCIVESLSEYIAAIEKYNLFDCISRGEKREYETPLRSGIHRKNFKNYSKLLDAYHLDMSFFPQLQPQ